MKLEKKRHLPKQLSHWIFRYTGFWPNQQAVKRTNHWVRKLSIKARNNLMCNARRYHDVLKFDGKVTPSLRFEIQIFSNNIEHFELDFYHVRHITIGREQKEFPVIKTYEDFSKCINQIENELLLLSI